MDLSFQKDQIEKGFVLKEGYSWDAKLIDGKKNGRVIVKNEEEGWVSHVLQYENDKLNGICEFYDVGTLVEKRTFVNDIAEGWAWRIKDDDEEECLIYYDNGHKSARLERCNDMDNYWKAIDIESNDIVSVCSYDENHNPIGKGYIFENGKIKRVVMFENGKEKEVLKSFNQDEMIVFENGSIVYKGCFSDDLSKDYPREGKGKEYCGKLLLYLGGWKNDKREGQGKTLKDGFAEYEGEWKDGLPNGFGLLKRDGKSYKDNWDMGKLRLNDDEMYDYACGQIVTVIENEDQLRELLKNEDKKRNVKGLVIGEGCGNEMKDDLELCGFENLESIVVKKDTLKNLNSLKISDNPLLKSIEIEDGDGGWSDDSRNTGAFYNVKNVTITSTLIYD